jgi:hypothetical protein
MKGNEENAMKRKMIRALLAVALMSSSVETVLGASLEKGSEGLVLTLQSSRPSYVPGELVDLKIKVINQAGHAVPVAETADVWTGAVRVFIDAGEGGFKEYRGPGWGLKCVVRAARVEIPQRGSFETAATVLYNHRQETGHLSEMYAHKIKNQELGTDYAFARPGTYRLKAVLQTEGGRLESEVLEIDIREPQGADRSVWEVLRKDPELGYFMQTGGPKGPPETPRSRHLEATLARLAGSFPESRQVESIRAGLAGYRTLLEALRASQMPDGESFREE